MVDQSKQIQEQNKQIIDLAKNSNNTTCKDDIHLNDLIQSIESSIEDLKLENKRISNVLNETVNNKIC